MYQGNAALSVDAHWEKSEVRVRPVSGKLFPGQYYDQETGLHYNYYRTYDPSTGRYLESDPIGVRGLVSGLMFRDGFNIVDMPELLSVGTHVQPDFYSVLYGALNTYGYASSNPLIRIDLFGLSDYPACKNKEGFTKDACNICFDMVCKFVGVAACCYPKLHNCLSEAKDDIEKREACRTEHLKCVAKTNRKPKMPKPKTPDNI